MNLFSAALLSACILSFIPKNIAAAKEESASELFSPVKYGALADGHTLDTSAFQTAILAARAAGGGTVSIPPGTYLIGTIDLFDGVTLHLEKGATLLGSPRLADYRRGNWPALIKAQGQRKIAITGEGVIDGQGSRVAEDTIRIFASGNFVDFFPGLKQGEKVHVGNDSDPNSWIDPYAMQSEGSLGKRVAPRSRADAATWRVDEFVRPQLLEFWQCQEVRVSGVTLKNAANWVETYRDCEDVLVEHIRVESTTYWNNDGLDVVNSRRVRIQHCDINSADDGICLKTEPSGDDRGCLDITVANCRIRSSASAFKLGTSSYYDFRNIEIKNLEVYDTFRSAIAMESVDGGVIENVKVSNINARNTGNAFFIRLGARNNATRPGAIRNISLNDLSFDVPAEKPDRAYAHAGPPITTKVNLIPSSITGLDDAKIENVSIKRLKLIFGGTGSRARAEVTLKNLGSIPEKRDSYPEFSMFGELPAWALYIRHVKHLRLDSASFTLAAPDFRAALVADDMSNLELSNAIFHSSGEDPVIVLSSVVEHAFDNIRYSSGSKEKVRVISDNQSH